MSRIRTPLAALAAALVLSLAAACGDTTAPVTRAPGGGTSSGTSEQSPNEIRRPGAPLPQSSPSDR